MKTLWSIVPTSLHMRPPPLTKISAMSDGSRPGTRPRLASTPSRADGSAPGVTQISLLTRTEAAGTQTPRSIWSVSFALSSWLWREGSSQLYMHNIGSGICWLEASICFLPLLNVHAHRCRCRESTFSFTLAFPSGGITTKEMLPSVLPR